MYDLFNSQHLLHRNIVHYSLNNMTTTTMGENIRYFMYKCDISIDEWKGSHNNILSKIKHVLLLLSTDENIVNGMLIRELYMQRDIYVFQST